MVSKCAVPVTTRPQAYRELMSLFRNGVVLIRFCRWGNSNRYQKCHLEPHQRALVTKRRRARLRRELCVVQGVPLASVRSSWCDISYVYIFTVAAGSISRFYAVVTAVFFR